MDELKPERCSKCGAEAKEPTKFCGACGVAFVPMPKAVPVPGEDGVFYCAKHKKETTRVTCGRCEKPICHRCMIIGPAGVRCKECARNRVPIRARGVLHDVTSGVTRSPVANRVWYMVAFAFIINLISDLFGGFGRRS